MTATSLHLEGPLLALPPKLLSPQKGDITLLYEKTFIGHGAPETQLFLKLLSRLCSTKVLTSAQGAHEESKEIILDWSENKLEQEAEASREHGVGMSVFLDWYWIALAQKGAREPSPEAASGAPVPVELLASGPDRSQCSI